MIDRIMQKFADHYTAANPDTFGSPDTGQLTLTRTVTLTLTLTLNPNLR